MNSPVTSSHQAFSQTPTLFIKKDKEIKLELNLSYLYRQVGFMESLALERVYGSKFGFCVPWLSFDATKHLFQMWEILDQEQVFL